MKKLLIIIFVFCGLDGYSQVYFPVFPTIYGQHSNRIRIDSALNIPEKQSLSINSVDSSAQIFFNKNDSSFWGYSLSTGFSKLAGISRSTIDSILGGYYSIGQVDSIVAQLRTEGRIDSLSFHTASLNFDSTQLSLIRPNGTKDTIEVWADGFVPSVVMASGTYVPTITITSGNASSPGHGTSTSFKYTRIGNIVTVSGYITAVVTATGSVSFEVSLPIASTFTDQSDATGSVGGGWQSLAGGLITADNTNNTISIGIGTTSTGGRTYSFICQYIIK